jgi:hypothetical protein
MVRCTLIIKSHRACRGQMKTPACTLNAFACCCCCWFHLNGYRGSADQTHAALIIMCVCAVYLYVFMHALSVATMPETQSQPSHLKEETSTSAAALIRDTGKQQSRPCFYRGPFLLSFLLILEHPGKENIQLDLQALACAGISYVGLPKGDVRESTE